ncbi:MAG TPA: hypothetical protein VIT91_07725 [Chthoniobacterales bacterium]
MRRPSALFLLAAFAFGLASCGTSDSGEKKKPTKYGDQGTATPTPTPKPTPRPTPAPDVTSIAPEVTPVPTPTPTPAAQDYPVATAIEGKPGFVVSPYNSSGIVDVRGYPPGTEVRDPYSGKIFLVP